MGVLLGFLREYSELIVAAAFGLNHTPSSN
jgi:hypothetical protein